jgi:hypothetical protein
MVKALVSIKKYLATSQPRVLDHNRSSYYIAGLNGALVVRKVVQVQVSLRSYLACFEHWIIIELPIMLQC